MDIFAHALWTNLIFMEADTPTRVTAIALSVLPDIVPFAPTALRRWFGPRSRLARDESGRAQTRPVDIHFSEWAYRGYDFTHSIPIWLVVFAVWWVVAGRIPLPMFGWLIHIMSDIPTHSRSFFATPFLWPISKYKWDGVSWGRRWFMRLNYGALATLYLVAFIRWIVTRGA